jgi:hypothetical protein
MNEGRTGLAMRSEYWILTAAYRTWGTREIDRRLPSDDIASFSTWIETYRITLIVMG